MFLLQIKTPEGYVSNGAFVGIFYELFVLISLALLIANVYRIYYITKLKITLNLFVGFFFYALAIFFSWIAKIYLWKHMESALEGPYWLQLIYKFKISLACVVVANFFILQFFKTIFNKHFTKELQIIVIIVKIIEIVVILIIHIPAYLVRSSEIAYTTDTIAFLIICLDMLFCIPFGIKSFRSVHKEAFGKKYLHFGLMAFFLVNIFIMFAIDRLTMMLGMMGPFGEPGYTPFYFAAWMSAIASIIFAIYGIILK